MIRHANKYDLPDLIEMMRDYAGASEVQVMKKHTLQDEKNVRNLLVGILAGRGFILVDNDYRGMIVGIITPNIWASSILELRELAWWVKPEYRQGMIGGKLWIEFDRIAEKLKSENRIQFITTTRMETSPTLDYTKRGYKKLETTYFKE